MSDLHDEARVGTELAGPGDPFASAVRATRMPMVVTDPRRADNPIVFANDAFVRLTGYPRGEIVGRNCRFLQGPATDPEQVAKLRDGIARRVPVEVELRNHRKDGSTFWNRVLVAPVFDRDGALTHFFASQYDVTHEHDHLRELNAALKRSEGVLDALVRSSSEVRYRISADWSSLRQLSGGDFIADASAENHTWLEDYIPPEDRPAVRAEIARAIETKTPYDIEHRVFLVDGSVGWAASRAVPIFDDRGDVAEWYGAASNITERKRAEGALRSGEAYWRALFERLDEGFMVVDIVRDGSGAAQTWRLVEANAAWERITGLSYGTSQGRTVEEIVPAIEPEWRLAYARVADTGEPASFTMPSPVLGQVYDVRASRIGPDRVAVLFRDVSEPQREAARRGALLKLNDRLRDLDDPEEISFVAAEIIGGALGAGRVGYGAMSPDGDTLIVARDWTAPGYPSAAGQHRMDSYGSYIADLRRGEVVAIDDALLDPRTAATGTAALEAHAVRSLVNLPIVENGRLVAMLFVNGSASRAWTPGEIGFIRNASDHVRATIERRRAESALRDLAASLEGQVRARTRELDRAWRLSQELLVIARPDGTIEAVNPSWTAVLGWTESEVVGRRLVDFTHPGDLAATLVAFAGIAERPLVVPYEYRIRHRDGTHRWASWTGAFEDGRIYAAGRDITADKRREEALRESEARSATYFNFSEDYLFLVRVGADGDVRFDDMNPACERVMGLARADIVGREVEDFVPAEAAHDIALHARLCLETRQSQSYLAPRRYREDRPKLIIEGRVAFVERHDGGGGLVLFSGHDVTEQRGIEEALRQSQKLEAVGQLTGGVAHDFNNLLTVIKSSTDLLKRPDLPEARRARYVGAISDTVDRATRLTGQLLAFARRQALQPEVFAACDGVRAIADMMGTLTGARIRLVTELPAARSFVRADPSQFDTALVNMAVNARDAMDGEGRLTVRVEAVDGMPALRSHPAVPGPFVAISLSDTGTGIPADRLDQIFEPFFTTKEVGKGTGLGLSQVFGFAKQSGGEVGVASTVGQGTTFTLYLPQVDEGPRPAAAADAPDGLPGGRRLAVLIVEDNPDVGGFSRQILEDLGHATAWATTAEDALARLGADGAGFDVVFSDVVMPGMGGVALAEILRERLPFLPVVLTSGYSHVLAREGGHGFDLLHKPYSADQLARAVQRATARFEPERR